MTKGMFAPGVMNVLHNEPSLKLHLSSLLILLLIPKGSKAIFRPY
jgi:hypothetical protein